MKEKLQLHTCWKKTTLAIEDTIMLTELCIEVNYFQYKESFYKQLNSAAMGSLISPIFAEFCMQKLEETVIPTLGNIVYSWWRYVDDTFGVVKINAIDDVLEKSNNFHPSI